MTVRLAMKYAEVESGHVSDLILDDKVVLEQKFDGTCVMAIITGDGSPIRFLQRGGKVLAHTAATQHLERIRPALQRLVGHTPGELVVVGELMVATGEYHLFDVPYARFGGLEVVTPDMPYYQRRASIAHTPELTGSPVHVSAMAEGRRQKQNLLDAVRESGGEGVMAKHIEHPYLPGGTSKQAVKLKFVKTADVVVTSVNRPDPKHGSFTLGVYASETPALLDHQDGGFERIIPAGGASAIGKDETIQPGDVVEVAYLYWTGVSLYQPRVIKKRTDKAPHECLIDQLPTYSRETIKLSDH